MDAVVKELWVEALRSGAYKQGRYELRTPHNTFCCLGVLCDVLNPLAWDDDKEHIKTYIYLNVARSLLPDDIRQDVGITAADQQHLIHMNDEGMTFDEIANFIEKAL